MNSSLGYLLIYFAQFVLVIIAGSALIAAVKTKRHAKYNANTNGLCIELSATLFGRRGNEVHMKDQTPALRSSK
jgi:hypothetical protein